MYTRPMASKRSEAPWLVLLFSLPRTQASGRVDVWRRLKRSGALALESSGPVLPNRQETRERFEWLAENVRHYKGTAQVLTVESFSELSTDDLKSRFIQSRNADYGEIITAAKNTKRGNQGEISRLRKRLQDVIAIDQFGGVMRERAEQAVAGRAGSDARGIAKKPVAGTRQEFRNRVWQTRPRPGIDRSASA